MDTEQLEALRPQIEQREQQKEAAWKAKMERMRLLLRACQVAVIPSPLGGKHWWSEKVCPKCGCGLRGEYDYTLSERHLLIQCKGCDYEYLS